MLLIGILVFYASNLMDLKLVNISYTLTYALLCSGRHIELGFYGYLTGSAGLPVKPLSYYFHNMSNIILFLFISTVLVG